jgi:antitoxin HicB
VEAITTVPYAPLSHPFVERLIGTIRRECLVEHAADALATAIDAYIKDRRDIPLPSAIVTKHRVTPPALVETKVRLYETMRLAKVGKSELAKRLNWHLPQVDRLLEMTHGSKLAQLEAAFAVLGKRLVVRASVTSTRRKAAAAKPRFAVCIRNEGYEALLERNKICPVLPDEEAERDGDLRVVDESGEDYLFSADRFVAIEVPSAVRASLLKASRA